MSRQASAQGDGARTVIAHLRERAARHVASAGIPVSPDALREIVGDLIDEERRVLPAATRVATIQAVIDETLGFGPLERILRDPTVTEVMVNGPNQVFVERSGCLERTELAFDDAAHLLHVIDRILSPLGRRVDEASPMVDARLPDGSRVNAIIPPLSLNGPTMTIRRFGAATLDAGALVELGTMSAEMSAFLRSAVEARRNILVTGGTGSGKTTTLAAIAAFVPPNERVITIEDAAELRLTLEHVVRLESRPASLEGRGAISIRALVRNALRMRPDRIIVGEVRGGEALDMLAAMTTGHEGSLSTLHASSPADAIRRLQTLALMGDLEIPFAAVAEQVAHAIDLVVHQARLADGRRRITEVAAVTPGEHGGLLSPLVRFVGGDDGRAATEHFAWTEAAARWGPVAPTSSRLGGVS